MKKLTDYIAESEQWMESPDEGDTFGIELEDDTLLETYVMEVAEDGSVLLDSTEEIYSLLESWNMLSEDIDGDVVEKAMSPRNTAEVEEAAPLIPLAAMAGGALARHAGAGALGQMAGRVAGHAVGSAIDSAIERRRNQEPVNEFDTGCGCDHDHTADAGEYDEEGDMAKNELLTIVRAARRLTGMLDNDDNMPEWTQKKITKAADYVDTAADYISSQKERGIMEQPDDGSPVARAVLHRIMMQHPGVLATHGPERVMAAVDELADRVNIGPDDEIGSSDVSGWTRDVIRMLAELPDEPMNVGDALDEQGVAEGLLGDREYNRVMPFVKRIAGEVSDYDRDEFGEELWSLLDQRYGSKFAQSVLADLDIYWDTYTELTGRGLDEASVYKKDQDLSSVSTQELEAFVKKNWGGGIPTYGQGQSVKRAMRELRRRQKSGVSEAEIDDTWMNDRHQEFYKRNPHFKRNDRERVEVGRGTQLATRVKPAVDPAQVQKKPATRFGMGEAEYQGRDVELNKPKRGGPKKFYVYVKNPKTGNVKKVTFGDPNMKIKKSNPDRRKSFRARHRCDNPGPKTSARYWACRAW